jgi:hypothetical protein
MWDYDTTHEMNQAPTISKPEKNEVRKNSDKRLFLF